MISFHGPNHASALCFNSLSKWIKHHWFLYFSDRCQPFNVFEARGSPGGQRGQTNIWFALWLWGRNTSQADSQGIQNQTEVPGVFIQKASLFNSNNLTGSTICDYRNEKLKDVLAIFFSWDFSLSWDVLHRCPCLLWALLINKTRLSLTWPSTGFKSSVYTYTCVCVSQGVYCTCARGKSHKVLQWWMNSNPAYSVWLINVVSSVQKPVCCSFLWQACESQPTFLSRARFIFWTFFRADHIQLASGKSTGNNPKNGTGPGNT